MRRVSCLTPAVVLAVLAIAAAEIRAQEPAAKTAAAPRRYVWKQVASHAPFAPRDGAGALVFQDQMWLLGGWNPHDAVHFPKKTNSEVWSSRDGREWTLRVPQAPWEGRHTAGYAVFQDKMWIVGGDPLQGRYQPDVWNSADGLHWTKICDRAPWGQRALHHTVAFDGKLWVLGGQTLPQFAPAAEAFYNDVWNSSDGATWRRVIAQAPWAPRGQIGGSAVFRGRLWILGGGSYDTPGRPLPRTMYNDVWSSADGVHWQCATPHAPWAPREYHDVAVFDNRLWVLEGWNAANRKDVWYSDDGATWQELPHTPWAPRHAASVFVYDGALWMVAGNNMESDVWRLDVVDAAAH